MKSKDIVELIEISLEKGILTYSDLVKIINNGLRKITGPTMPNQRQEEEQTLKESEGSKKQAEILEGEGIITNSNKVVELGGFNKFESIIPNQRQEEEQAIKESEESRKQAEMLEAESTGFPRLR